MCRIGDALLEPAAEPARAIPSLKEGTLKYSTLLAIGLLAVPSLGAAQYSIQPSSGGVQSSTGSARPDPYAEQKRLDAVRAEIERRRAARPKVLPTAIQLNSYSALPGDMVAAVAVLSSNRVPLKGKKVTFTFPGGSQSAITDRNGWAVARFGTQPKPGKYDYTASFPGDNAYGASQASAYLHVTKRNTMMSVVAQSSGTHVVILGTLKDRHNKKAVAGKTVNLMFAGSVQSAITDIGGVARAYFKKPYTSGRKAPMMTYSAKFGGDAIYNGSSASGRLRP
ncbi:MAG: Ig-like domain repeat protein [Elusimicrobia bacterium]|nr:Ig-like domain repeat protein [Elusimicrobiota bacterium]